MYQKQRTVHSGYGTVSEGVMWVIIRLRFVVSRRYVVHNGLINVSSFEASLQYWL